MAKLVDTRDWEADYKKLKINFDRLDRFNDVLYRYYFYTDVRKDLPDKASEAKQGVRDYIKELEDAAEGRRDSEAPKQEG
jgi:hypothetical protein